MGFSDPETYDHSRRVDSVASFLSRTLPTDLIPPFTASQREILRRYLNNTILHDIGKFALAPTVPESIKILHHEVHRKLPLPPNRERLRTHTLIGSLIIERLWELGIINANDAEVAENIALMHHLVLNSGFKTYPAEFADNLAQLAPAAQTAMGLIALIDKADAMLTRRSYRAALPRQTVEEILQKSVSESDVFIVRKSVDWDETQNREILLVRQIVDQASVIISATRANEINYDYHQSLADSQSAIILNDLAAWVWDNHGDTIK